MKCPKCGYLGFETGDRCRNCGYDFSLLVPAPATAPDLAIRTDDAETGAPELWLDRLDRSMDEVTHVEPATDHLIGVPPAPPSVTEAALPLFNPDDPDDIPLITLPAAPRPPLAVRRTPDTPRLRAVPRALRARAPELDFHTEQPEPTPDPESEIEPSPDPSSRTTPAASTAAPAPSAPARSRQVGGRRLAAGVIDHLILFAIDLGVLYFTLRMAGLGVDEVRLLPIVPMLTFVGLVKISYFSAFTAIGGQTIGKMALGIRVVADRGAVDGVGAVRRTLASVLSLAPLGLGYLPAFVGADRRALHDRLTGTRVVGATSA